MFVGLGGVIFAAVGTPRMMTGPYENRPRRANRTGFRMRICVGSRNVVPRTPAAEVGWRSLRPTKLRGGNVNAQLHRGASGARAVGVPRICLIRTEPAAG